MLAQTTSIDLLQIIKDGGIVVFALVLVWAILTQRLVPGWVYKDSVRREEKWQEIALRSTHLTGEAIGTLHDVAETRR